MSSCNCEVCKYNKEFKFHIAILHNHGLYQQMEFFRAMHENLIHLEMDNDYHTAILDGSWPNSKEILTRSLLKYKEVLGD